MHELLDEIINYESSLPMSMEQCMAHGLKYPSLLVTTKSGISATIFIGGNFMLANIPATLVANEFDKLESLRNYDGSDSGMKLLSHEHINGVARIEGGRCFVQVSTK